MAEHVIETVEELRSSYGAPSERAVRKSLDRLDRHCRRFIELSPFVVLASAGADGRVDCSPRGDPAGFVAVLDDKTVLLPDRRGNNRADSLTNVLENPHVGMLFMIPGVDETLRLNGRASLTTDPDAPRAPRGQRAGAAERARRRGRGGLPPMHQGPRPFPALGGRDEGGPQVRPPVLRPDARRPHRRIGRREGRSRDPREGPRDPLLIAGFGTVTGRASAVPPSRNRPPRVGVYVPAANGSRVRSSGNSEKSRSRGEQRLDAVGDAKRRDAGVVNDPADDMRAGHEPLQNGREILGLADHAVRGRR